MFKGLNVEGRLSRGFGNSETIHGGNRSENDILLPNLDTSSNAEQGNHRRENNRTFDGMALWDSSLSDSLVDIVLSGENRVTLGAKILNQGSLLMGNFAGLSSRSEHGASQEPHGFVPLGHILTGQIAL